MGKRTNIAPGIAIGSTALVFVIAITVGWNLIFPYYYDAAYADDEHSSTVGLWIIMGLGDLLLSLVILALAFFLSSNIRRSLHIRRQLTFIDTITHELKTPLTSLSLSLDTFKRREISDEMRNNIIERMDQDIKRLSHFINHVVDANRLEHGERQIQMSACNLSECIETCVERIRERYQLDESCIQLSLPEDPVSITADTVALETVILNLIDNAVKYSPRDIVVSCSLSVEADSYIFRVKDQGLGLSSKDLKRIFHRFSRVSQQSQISGSGLGLYLVKQLLERMHMQITVESDGLGYGSCFIVHIPRKAL